MQESNKDVSSIDDHFAGVAAGVAAATVIFLLFIGVAIIVKDSACLHHFSVDKQSANVSIGNGVNDADSKTWVD